MPIRPGVPITPIEEQAFHQLDYQIMKMVFAIHNEMGRFWDEDIFKNELAHRCELNGFNSVGTEVPVYVSFKDFIKTYYIDLLIHNSVIYELKTAVTLNEKHWNQVLNYLFLTGLQHGKLVNFRPASVEYRFVSTRMNASQRYNYKIHSKEWNAVDAESDALKTLLEDLLHEWGALLDVQLFYEAIFHYWGGEDKVAKRIEVMNQQRHLGRQKVYLLNPDTGFILTSILEGEEQFENHLQKFVRYLPIKTMQWVNFKRLDIGFKTIRNDSKIR